MLQVLKLFLDPEVPDKQDGGRDDVEYSGSGDGESADDNEAGDAEEPAAPTNTNVLAFEGNEYKNTGW